ncbi:hypothetical protein HDU82_001839, partial [Entophlyctis luteolus]
MDTVGTFDMAVALGTHGMITCIHKHYTVDQWKAWGESNRNALGSVAVSAGTSHVDLDRVKQILGVFPEIPFICLDVANGYSEHFVEAVKSVHATFPRHTIIAGNVVSGEMTEELILAGADIIKVLDIPNSVRYWTVLMLVRFILWLSSTEEIKHTDWEDTWSLMAVVRVQEMSPKGLGPVPTMLCLAECLP